MGMPRRKPLTWFLAIILVITAGTSLVVHRYAGPGRTDGAYAYITERVLVIRRGDRTVARVPRTFSLGNGMLDTVVWTHSGDYLAILSDATVFHEDASGEELISVDTDTGRVRRMPCPDCYDIAAIGDDTIAALTSTNESSADPTSTIQHFDLARSTSDTPTPLPPPANAGSFLPSFLGSTREYLLISRPITAGTTEARHLILVNARDSVESDYGLFRSAGDMSAAVTADEASGEPRFAVVFRPNSGECLWGSTVSVLTRRGVTRTTLTGPAVGAGRDVKDVWWDQSGALHASLTTWTCDESRRADDRRIPGESYQAVWRPTSEQWKEEGFDPATMVRRVDAQTRAELRIPDCMGPVSHPDPEFYCHTGTLHRYHGGTQELVAKDVIRISTPPHQIPGQSPGRAPAEPAGPVRLGDSESFPHATGTTITRIDPFAPDGSPQPPYSVESGLSLDDIDCSFDEGSPVALAAGTHACGTTADDAGVCWSSPRYPEQILCLASAWDTVLHARRTPRITTTRAARTPVPLGLELADGSQWWHRVGGAWGGRADGYQGAYGCRSGSSCDRAEAGRVRAVLTRPDVPVIDTSGPSWTVLVGELGDPNRDFPPPERIAVTRAWFIAGSPPPADGK